MKFRVTLLEILADAILQHDGIDLLAFLTNIEIINELAKKIKDERLTEGILRFVNEFTKAQKAGYVIILLVNYVARELKLERALVLEVAELLSSQNAFVVELAHQALVAFINSIFCNYQLLIM